MNSAETQRPPSRPRTHEWIDQRSLALDEAVAKKLCQQPELLEKARLNLARWIHERQPTVPIVLLEWQTILSEEPIDNIIELLRSSGEEARRLRQSSPFCGILSVEERLSIFKHYETVRT
jgi:hypothetical protein